MDLKRQFLVCSLSMFLRSNRFQNAKNAILTILRAFLFSLKACCRFLIYTCYFADVDSLSGENILADLLSSPISI